MDVRQIEKILGDGNKPSMRVQDAGVYFNIVRSDNEERQHYKFSGALREEKEEIAGQEIAGQENELLSLYQTLPDQERSRLLCAFPANSLLLERLAFVAVENNDVSLIQKLAEAQFNFDIARDFYNRTLLHIAINHNAELTVKKLLEHMDSHIMEVKDGNCQTALDRAVLLCYPSLAEVLAKKATVPQIQQAADLLPLCQMRSEEAISQLVTLLHKNGAQFSEEMQAGTKELDHKGYILNAIQKVKEKMLPDSDPAGGQVRLVHAI